MGNKLDAKTLSLSSKANTIIFALIAVGLLSFAVGLATDAKRTWFSFLLNHSLFLGLGIGGLFFLVIHYLASAGWNVALRRVSEGFASYIFIGVLLNIVLFFGLGKIYPWTDHHLMETDHLLHGKMGYFSYPFYIGRIVFFSAMIAFFAWRMIQNSVAQDAEGGVERTNNQKPLAALFLVLFAPMFTVFSVDLIKSLDPKWFSTMFGVYVFVGFVQASVAATVIVIRMLQKQGVLLEVTPDHFHDLGKYLFGFSIFWAYIGVSQYLLIWYANLPEETTFYLAREKAGWMWISLLLPALRFVLPFLLLLPRMAKRNVNYLSKVAWIVLLGAWVDLYWLIMPTVSPDKLTFSFWDIGLLVGFIGVFAFMIRRFFSKNLMVPVKDPYLHETLHHHVM
ncbi:MAG: molybdopterin oxidoreductase [Oligoflexia bacterium]|nr:molybdopterin oxidoreductase [Oligoflexia bacterium]